jgi:HSP20 family protein
MERMAIQADPFAELVRLQEQLARLLGVSTGSLLGGSPSGVYPPVNLFRTRDGAVLRAELPGVRSEDVSVMVERQQLTISGERRPPEGDERGYHRRERPWGKFSRSVRLPDDLDLGRVEAQCRDGVLTVLLPIAEVAKPRQISVKA